MVFLEGRSKILENTKNQGKRKKKGPSIVVIGIKSNVRGVALYLHVRLALGIVAGIGAAIRVVIVHV